MGQGPWTKNRRKQDWSPRDIPVSRNKAVLLYQGEDWWAAMKVFRKKMRAYNFERWLVRRARAKRSRLWIYRQLLWSEGVRGEALMGRECKMWAQHLAAAVIQKLASK